MEYIKYLITDIIATLYKNETNVVITRPDSQFGDFATNVAVQLARPLGKNPREIAEEIARELNNNEAVAQASVAGPGFINITVSAQNLMAMLERDWSEQYGENNDGAGKTVVVEYPSPNMAKPYSIGHFVPPIRAGQRASL